MEKAGYTRYATDIFASTMKTNELSSIRTSYSLSNPPGSSHLAEARPATSSNYSRRHATGIGRVLSQPMERGGVRTVTSWLILDPQIGRTLSFCTSNADGAAAHSSRQHPTGRANIPPVAPIMAQHARKLPATSPSSTLPLYGSVFGRGSPFQRGHLNLRQ